VVTSNALTRVLLFEFQLEQLFQNLIGNALRYHGEKLPRIHVAAKMQDPLWLFSVEDNGIGIEPRFREQVLASLSVFTLRPSTPGLEWDSRFASVSSSAPEDESGSSLNEAGVRHFTLRSLVRRTLDQPNRPARSIILTEDNPADAGLVRESLCQHGVCGDLVGITDGDSAIRFIESLDSQPGACPDLVILDLNLPKCNGLEVLKAMRRSVKCRNTPVVILSSSDLPQDKDESLRLGASRYIRKPHRLAEFLALGAIFQGLMTDPV